MLEKIKQVIFQKYKKDDCKGIFLSVFDEKNILLMSNGVLFTDKVLDNILDTLYHGLVEKYKNIGYIAVDVVIDTQELLDISKLNEISLQDNGVALVAGSKFGVILPDTVGLSDINNALTIIKDKNGLQGNAKIVVFKTERFLIEKFS